MNYEIYLNGELVNTIWASEEFVKQFCKENGYTYQLRKQTEPVAEESSELEDLAAMLVDQEYRLTLLELGVTE